MDVGTLVDGGEVGWCVEGSKEVEIGGMTTT
jgi:hypothetical protein